MTGVPPASGARALLDVLSAYGIEHLFCSPGSEWPPLWEELARRAAQGEPAPRYWNVRHEILAVAMGSGYAKITGRLPVVLLHTTVGVLSGSLALRAAHHEEIPMLVLAGESIAFGEDGFEPGAQWLRYLADRGGPVRLGEACVKWSLAVNTPAILASTVHRAAQIAMTPPRGPVLISVPFEFLAGPARPLEGGAFAFVPPPVPDGAGLDRAADLLAASRAPLIVTETAGADAGAAGALVRLAEALGAGVVEGLAQTYVGFPRRHPLHAGFDARPHLDAADVVLLAGAVGPWHPASRGPSGAVIALGENVHRTGSPYWGYRTDCVVPGALGAGLAGLADRVAARLQGRPEPRERAARWQALNEARRQAWRHEARARAGAKPIDPRWLGHVLAEALPHDAIVVEETITHRRAIVQALDRLERGAFLGGQSGGLGVGLGLALGARCAAPQRPVVALIGDGAFHYNPVPAALGLCQEYDLPLVTVLFDNGGYASMKRGVPAIYPDGWAVRTETFLGAAIAPRPDYGALARAYGGHGETIDDPGEIRAALDRGLAAAAGGRPALVHVVLEGG